jgi:uncharacterized protein (DUF1778 family)
LRTSKNVVPRKKSRSTAAPPTRKPGALPRKHHMHTDFSAEQKKLILAYCAKHNISVSQFLAEVAVNDANESLHRRAKEQEEEITITLRIPRDKRTKLEIFAERRGETIEDHIRAHILPLLEKQQTSFPLKTESVRYYLNKNEHELVIKQLKKRGLSGRNYVAFLALQKVKPRVK